MSSPTEVGTGPVLARLRAASEALAGLADGDLSLVAEGELLAGTDVAVGLASGGDAGRAGRAGPRPSAVWDI